MVRTVNLGEVVQGDITSPGAETLINFEATAGQEIIIDFDDIAGGRLTWELFAPSGRIEDREFTFSGNGGDTRLVLEESGQYGLRVTGSGDDTPTFTLEILEPPAPVVRTVTPGQSVISTIVPFGQDHLEFTALAGEAFELDFSTIDGGSLGYSIFGPNGDEIFTQRASLFASTLDSDQILLADTGTYRIELFTQDSQPTYQVTALFGSVDLQVDSVEIPSSGFTGQEIAVSWVVTNHGTRATNATNWTDRVFLLSVDTSNRFFLGNVANASFLEGGESYASSGTFTLPETLTGDFQIIVETDSRDGVNEVDEQNNSTTSPDILEIELSPQPDLVIVEVEAPAIAFSGQVVSLSYTGANLRGADIVDTQWRDSVYLSSDNVLDADDVFLRDVVQPARTLAVGENYFTSTSVELPVGVTGDFFFIVVADSFGENGNVQEIGFEDNNVGVTTTTTQVRQTPPPDLEVSLVTTAATALASNELVVNYEVTNFGSTETPNSFWNDRIFLSLDNTLDPENDLLIGSNSRSGALNAEESYSESVATVLPDAISGEYFVFVLTDSEDVVFEFSNDNNTSIGQSITVESRPADLAISEVGLPSAIAIGQSLLASYTVENIGVGDTEVSNWRDQIFLSTDNVFGNSDDIALQSNDQEQVLVAGESYQVVNQAISVPIDIAAGDYFLFVATDVNDAVFEDGNEANNVSVASPITVQQESANLIVTEVLADESIVAGSRVNVSFTVTNVGTDSTAANFSIDEVYLSTTGEIDSDAILLKRIQRTNQLGGGEQYTRTVSVDIPLALSGDYFVVVQADADDNIREADGETDNIGVSAIASTIEAAAVADLQIVDLIVPEVFSSGRTVDVTYTVRNEGSAVSQSRRSVDSFYLSLNDQLDTRSDRQLGFALGSDDLLPGEEYTRTVSLVVPAGLAGPFFLFAVADGNDAVAELAGEDNNEVSQVVSVQLPQPVDFVVGSITVPANAVAGQQVTIDYTVSNLSANTAFGSVVDSVYLSADGIWDINDPLIGRVTHVGDVEGGASYTESLTAALPGVVPGDYQVIIRSDILNQIRETDDANNIGVALNSTTVDFEQIAIDSSAVASVANGESVYYQVEVAAGETLLINVGNSDSDATAEVFVSLGDVPTRSNFDFAGIEPFEANQFVTVPITEAGTYFILVSGNDSSNGVQDLTTTARLLQFESIDTDFGLGGNAGQLTIEINGAQFDRTLQGRLTNSSGADVASSATFITDSTKAFLTFDLRGLDAGDFDVVLENGAGESFTVEDGLEVVDGGGSQLVTAVNVPSAVGAERAYNFNVEYSNIGLNDVLVPVFEVTNSQEFGLSPDDLSLGTRYRFLATQTSDGPPGILRPGQSELETFYTESGSEVGINRANLTQIYSDPTAPFDFEAELSSRRPAGVSVEEFQPILDELILRFGPEVGDFLEILSRNSALVSAEDGDNRNVDLLIDLEISRVLASLGRSIEGFASPVAGEDLRGKTIVAHNTTTDERFGATIFNDLSFLFPVVTEGDYNFEIQQHIVEIDGPEDTVQLAGDDSIEGVSVSVSSGASFIVSATDSDGNSVESFGAAAFDDQGRLFPGEFTDRGFEIVGLEPGDYAISIEAAGFGQQLVNASVTEAGVELSVSVELQAEAIAEATVLFNGQPPEEEVFGLATLVGGSDIQVSIAVINGNSLQFRGLTAGVYEYVIVAGENGAAGTFEVNTSQILTPDVIELGPATDSNLTTSSTFFSQEFSEAFLAARTRAFLETTVVPYEKYFIDPEAASLMRAFLDGRADNPPATRFYGAGSRVSNLFINSVAADGAFRVALISAVNKATEKLANLGLDKESEVSIIYNIRDLIEPEQASPNINFGDGNTLPGHIAGGRGGFALAGLTDSREITGTIQIDLKDGVVTGTSNLRLTVRDSFDFLDGGNGGDADTFLYSEADVVSMLRLLEARGEAYGVPFVVVGNDRTRTRTRNLPQDEHSEEECPEDGEETRVVQSVDPNDILGPNGFGEQNFIAADQPLNYTIRFENDPVFATAPAQVVTITQTLDSDLDARTFRVGNFAIGENLIEVPANRSFYSDRIDLTEELGVFVDVSIGIDVQTSEAFWNFTAIDPETGDVPENPFLGLLAPNITSPEGEGFANYSVRAKRDSVTGDVIDAQARIVFDVNDPIDTPPIFHTLDAGKPSSELQAALVEGSDSNIQLSFSGTDNEDGSAVADYTIFVSTDGGPAQIFLENTTLTSAIFVGEAGREYQFFSVARDNVGNLEDMPSVADAVVSTSATFGSIGDRVTLDSNANGIFEEGETGVSNVTVNLFEVDTDGTQTLRESVQTDSDGFYQFVDVETTGQYQVQFVGPEGFALTLQGQGTDALIDSDADITTGFTDVFTIGAGDNFAVDAGFIQLGEINGTVLNDFNANQIQDAGETFRSDVTVYLDDNNNGALDAGETSTLTDADGRYTFSGLRPGRYYVAQVIPEGFEQTFPGIGTADVYTMTGSGQALVAPSEIVASTGITEASDLIGLNNFTADAAFEGIDGSGYSVVVIDTGIDVDHSFFGADADNDGVADRIVYQYDFADGDADATDITGHGSNVTSILASQDAIYGGVASGVDIISLKVFGDDGSGSFAYVEQALQWVINNASAYNIAAVNLSVGDGGNFTRETGQYGLSDELAALADLNVITVSAAGNNFARYDSQPGLAYPAADPNAISVGAVYDSNQGGPFVFGPSTDFETGPTALPVSRNEAV